MARTEPLCEGFTGGLTDRKAVTTTFGPAPTPVAVTGWSPPAGCEIGTPLQVAVAQDGDAFVVDCFLKCWRHQCLMVGFTDVCSGIVWVGRGGVDRPFAEAEGQIADLIHKIVGIAVDRDGETVEERLIGWDATGGCHLLSPVLAPRADAELVLVGQRQGEVKYVLSPAVGQAVPIQMRRVESRVEGNFDLGPELSCDVACGSPRE